MHTRKQNNTTKKPTEATMSKKQTAVEWLVDEMEWYAKKKHAEIVYRKCIKAKRYKWAMKIAYHYGLQDESRNDDTVMALGLALMSVRNSR